MLYDSEWLFQPDLKWKLEGDELKTQMPRERYAYRLKLLVGQICIALGEIETARQILTDGFEASQQTFGTCDVLTMEFRMSLAEVYIKRRDRLEIIDKSVRIDFCAITARSLRAKIL